MATLSYDGQSLIIDNRRVYLAAGDIDYTKVPRGRWRHRIRAAREAGLNAVRTAACWARHEPRSGRFDFSGENDLRHFIETVADEGLYCVLRAGPAIDDGTDLAGMPAWLIDGTSTRLRESDPAFMKACSRFVLKLFEQIQDLQVTPPTYSGPGGRDEGGGNGPIILVQAEDRWLCHNPEQGETYLQELVSYLRQNGCTVPITIGNNLWQRADGAVDTWVGSERLLADLRQLRAVAPEFPPMATGLEAGSATTWNGEPPAAADPDELEARMVSVLAAGGQLMISPFHGGTFFGTSAGRLSHDAGPGGWLTTSNDRGAPLTETGRRTDAFRAVKRVAGFATSFGHLLAHANPERCHHVTASTAAEAHPLGIVHHRGPQGDVVLLTRDGTDGPDSVSLVLPNGLSLEISMGEDRTAWTVLGANLGGVAELTWTNLRPWAFIGRRLLVLFGPAGADGRVSINRATLRVKVPTGRQPEIHHHEELTIAVLSREQVDAAVVADGGLLIGADGTDENGDPVALQGWRRPIRVEADGTTGTRVARAVEAPPAPKLTDWKQARLEAEIAGEDEVYETADGPAGLGQIGAGSGYAWYRLQRKNGRKQTVLPAGVGDRVHVFRDGKLETILGEGPNAEPGLVELSLSGTTTLLADCVGRSGSDWRLGEPRGVYDHVYTVKEASLGKAQASRGPVTDPFGARGFLPGLRRGDRMVGQRLTWSFTYKSTRPIVIDVRGLDETLVLAANGEAFGVYDPLLSAGAARFVLLSGEQLKRGNNELTVSAPGREQPLDPATLLERMKVWITTDNLTANAGWATAPWSVPQDDAFGTIVKSAGMLPCWFRADFELATADAPLWFEPRGLSKGRVLVNGHDAGRYWRATHTGAAVGPQKRIYLPEPWLRTDAPNELLVFDEHGKSPTKAKLASGEGGAFD